MAEYSEDVIPASLQDSESSGAEDSVTGSQEPKGPRDEIKVTVQSFQKTADDYTYDVEVGTGVEFVSRESHVTAGGGERAEQAGAPCLQGPAVAAPQPLTPHRAGRIHCELAPPLLQLLTATPPPCLAPSNAGAPSQVT